MSAFASINARSPFRSARQPLSFGCKGLAPSVKPLTDAERFANLKNGLRRAYSDFN